MEDNITLKDFAVKMDAEDQLSNFRDRFVNDANVIYLDGNSLGKLPKKTIDIMNKSVRNEWGEGLIRSWNTHWIDLAKQTAKKLAPLIGANADEVFVGDSTSINLYKLAFAALEYQKGKNQIVSDEINFPTDLYVIQGLIEHQFSEHELKLAKSADGTCIEEKALTALLGEETALITLSHVAYKSAFRYNMGRINKLAHDNGALTLWDLSHSAGALPIKLNESNADLAVGCTYKYLNGGPGAPAFLYVKKELQDQLHNPINSWFSHQKPFDFDLRYTADQSIQKFATGTPNILSLRAIQPGIDIILEAGIENIWKKSQQQSSFLLKCIKEILLPLGFKINSSEEADKRGSHISITHPEAYRINRALIEPASGSKQIIPDFRPPDNIRIGITPLYTSFESLFYACTRIKEIVEHKEYNRFGTEKLTVT